MNLGLILVMETSAPGKSDDIYIRSVLDHYYDLKGVTIARVFLDGKRNYSSKKVLSQIRSYQAMYRSQKMNSQVIYFIDTDSVSKVYDKGSFFSNVSAFCASNFYELVWFCKDVENVFLHKEPGTVVNKLNAAKEFVRTNAIVDISQSSIKRQSIEPESSNILGILDKYLKRLLL